MRQARRRSRRSIGALIGAAAALTLVAGAPANGAEVTAGDWKFDVQSTLIGELGYQVAHSPETDRIWVSASTHQFDAGYPVAAASSVTEVNPNTLQITRTITPRQLTNPNRPEAAYGLAVDDAHDRVSPPSRCSTGPTSTWA